MQKDAKYYTSIANIIHLSMNFSICIWILHAQYCSNRILVDTKHHRLLRNILNYSFELEYPFTTTQCMMI